MDSVLSSSQPYLMLIHLALIPDLLKSVHIWRPFLHILIFSYGNITVHLSR